MSVYHISSALRHSDQLRKWRSTHNHHTSNTVHTWPSTSAPPHHASISWPYYSQYQQQNLPASPSHQSHQFQLSTYLPSSIYPGACQSASVSPLVWLRRPCIADGCVRWRRYLLVLVMEAVSSVRDEVLRSSTESDQTAGARIVLCHDVG